MAIYMKVPGVDGSCTASGYKNWIELNSLDFNVVREVSMRTGNMSNRAADLPQFGEIMVSKDTENATYGILNEAVLGKEGKNIEIAVVEPGDTPTEYVKYVLNDCIVSSYSMSAVGGDAGTSKPVETAGISFSKIEVCFTTHDKANKGGGVPRVCYDLAEAKKG